ncbi:NACHT domain-containing protein [Kitasatospora sp. NPDC059646]|uniref:NACHT domain-containing protein n=1 Tax=Kitasatospora sp. NPDC059646 TaxID=3346893 RepID=UPI003687CFC8
MPAGRPPKDEQVQYPELLELASWFRQALVSAGYGTPNAFVRTGFAGKAAVYGVHNASRLLTLEFTKALATALGRDPAEVVPIWTRAKDARDRATAAEQQSSRPRLTSWSELPLPALALRNLLEAQSRSADRLPYDVLDVKEPPLSAIYVRQQMRAAVAPSREAAGPEAHGTPAAGSESSYPHASSTERDTVLPLSEIFERPGHLLVTGGPGSGKSTLTNHLTWLLSRVWLRQESTLAAPATEPLVPLRIAARALVEHSGSWSAALCHAAKDSMGHSLVAEADPGLFTGRVQGAQWLVLVDGLDEITDRQARAQLIRVLAQHARSDGAYRFLVTTRPLPEIELTPLRGAAFSSYRMEPFSRAELRNFATQWFRAQDRGPAETEAAASRFLRETEDGRLSELVQNPLLATLAAVSATIDPHRPLPANRLSLYQLFHDHLMSRGAGRDGRDGELAGWVRQVREQLVGALARHRIESDGSLEAAARRWVQEHRPPEMALTGRWEAELRHLLLGTALLVPQGDDLRFLHHSFAEFLAARSYAAEIPPDFPGLDSWAGKGVGEAEHTLALFTFCLWAERPDCDADLIVDHLLRRTVFDTDPVNLAGLLVAEGVRVSEQKWARILERLQASVRNQEDESALREAFATLSALADRPGTADRLRALAASRVLTATQRLGALEALSRVCAPSEAEALLADVLPGAYGELPDAARISLSLGLPARQAVLARTRSVREGPRADTWETAIAAEALEVLGEADRVRELAREVLADPSARSGDLQRAARAWLKSSQGRCADEVAVAALNRPVFDCNGRDVLARTLEESGEPAAAARVAEHMLRSERMPARQLRNAADIWARVHGRERPEPVVDALKNATPAAGQPPYLAAWLTRAAAEAGETRLAVEWARQVLSTPNRPTSETSLVVAAWLAAEGSAAAPAIMALLNQGEELTPFERPRCARELLDAGASAEAAVLAALALRTPLWVESYYKDAAGVLLKARPAELRPVVEQVLGEQPGPDEDWVAGVLAALDASTDSLAPLAATLAHRLLASPAATGQQISSALGTLVETEGLGYLPTVIRTVKTRTRLSVSDLRTIARGLAGFGQREAALECWRHALEILWLPSDQELELLNDLLAADAGAEAASWLREMIGRPGLDEQERLRLRQMLAWLGPALELDAR